MSELQEETVSYKDHVIMWRKDIGRTIDYIESRDDRNKDKIGFFGAIWHLVPSQDMVKETMSWYDRYLGEINKTSVTSK